MSPDGNLLPRYMAMQKSLLSSLHLKDVLEEASAQFAELTGGAKIAIFLSDNESQALKLMTARGYSNSAVETLKVVPFASESLLKYVVQKRMPFSVGPGQAAPDMSASIMKRESSVAQFALPLIASNLLVGAVLFDLGDPAALSSIDFYREVADVTAHIIANAVLFARSEYERQRLSTLYKSSCALSGSVLSLSEVLQIACDTAALLGNTPDCALLLYDPEKRAFNLAAFKGLDGSSLNAFDLSRQETIAGRCLDSGKLEYVQDATAYMHSLPCSSGGSPFGSLVAAPVVAGNNSIGVLMVLSTSPRAFAREQLDLLESLVQQVAAALHAALTHESATARTIEDAHTGLYNRSHFEDSLKRELERCQRHKHELSLMLIDVDHLAQVNEHRGQDKGDEAIRHVARLVKGSLRDIDIACRYGGEEFGVLLPETTLPAACDVAERLRQHVKEQTAPGIGTITVSIGLSSFPSAANSAEELLKSAGQALDVAKYEGRDRVKAAMAGQSTTGRISWEELARQAKLSVISERQAKTRGLLAGTAEYASWMGKAKGKMSDFSW